MIGYVEKLLAIVKPEWLPVVYIAAIFFLGVALAATNAWWLRGYRERQKIRDEAVDGKLANLESAVKELIKKARIKAKRDRQQLTTFGLTMATVVERTEQTNSLTRELLDAFVALTGRPVQGVHGQQPKDRLYIPEGGA